MTPTILITFHHPPLDLKHGFFLPYHYFALLYLKDINFHNCTVLETQTKVVAMSWWLLFDLTLNGALLTEGGPQGSDDGRDEVDSDRAVREEHSGHLLGLRDGCVIVE